MDHHCPCECPRPGEEEASLTPGINACVGLHNQRHFVLFMAWISAACWIVAVLGYPHFWTSVDHRHDVSERSRRRSSLGADMRERWGQGGQPWVHRLWVALAWPAKRLARSSPVLTPVAGIYPAHRLHAHLGALHRDRVRGAHPRGVARLHGRARRDEHRVPRQRLSGAQGQGGGLGECARPPSQLMTLLPADTRYTSTRMTRGSGAISSSSSTSGQRASECVRHASLTQPRNHPPLPPPHPAGDQRLGLAAPDLPVPRAARGIPTQPRAGAGPHRPRRDAQRRRRPRRPLRHGRRRRADR